MSQGISFGRILRDQVEQRVEQLVEAAVTKPRRGSSAPSSRPALRVGARVRVKANSNSHSYEVGRVYVISRIDDSDETCRARDPETGAEGNWVKFADLERVAGLGWDWLRTVLPPDDVALLERFEGLEELRLRPDLQSSLVACIPGLREAIVRTRSVR